jgi:hypothetical protein
MKFLLETEVFAEAPVERLHELITSQLARRSKGHGDSPQAVKVDAAYGVLGRRGAIAILDAPDAETLQKVLVFAPLFHFEKMVTTPLVDLTTSLTLMAEAAEKVSKKG